MNEEKTTILVENIIKAMNEEPKSRKSIKVCGQNIEVETILSLDVFDTFVTQAVDMLYSPDGEYIPNLKDFIIRICTVFAYTNVAFPNDFEEVARDLWKLMYGTNFFDLVLKAVDNGQYNAFLHAIESAVEYRNNNNIDRVNRQINELASGVNNLGEQLTDMFGNISQDDIDKLISAVENDKIDESKLIKAYVGERYATENNGESDE